MNPRQEAKLDHILRLLGLVLRKENAIMALEDDILSGIADLDSAEDSVIELLTRIKAQLDAAGTDQAKLAQVKQTIDAMKQKAASAVVANTPADTGGGNPPPPPPA